MQMQRYEMHKSQISDDFVYWFRNGEDIFQDVFKENFTQNVCLILESAILCKLRFFF